MGEWEMPRDSSWCLWLQCGFCFTGVALCFQPKQQHRGVLVPAEGGFAGQQHLPADLPCG